MRDPSVELLVINTNVRHELSGSEYAQRRAQCEEAAKHLKRIESLRDVTAEQLQKPERAKLSEVVYRHARHVIRRKSNALFMPPRGIRESNWPAVGQLMYASHYALRDDYEVSCQELDVVVGIAESIGTKGGVYGCRMTGGGFGGCCVALVRSRGRGNHLAEDRRRIPDQNEYRSRHLCFPPRRRGDHPQRLNLPNIHE